METLNVIAIPHTEQVLRLLEVLFFIGFSTFVLYFAFIFGGSFYSLFYYFKAISKKNEYFLNISKNYLRYVGKGYVALIGLGFVPLLAVYYALLQFLQKAPNDFFIMFFFSTALFITFVVLSKIMLKIEKKLELSHTNWLFVVLLSIASVSSFVSGFLTIGTYYSTVSNGFQLSGIYSSDLLNFNAIVRYLVFLAMAFILAPLGYIFKTYTVDKVHSSGNYFTENGSIKQFLFSVFILSNILSIVLFLMYLQIPKNLVTLRNFVYIVLSILVLLLCVIFSYFSLKQNKISFARYAFITAIVSFLLIFASETTLLAISTKPQQFKIAKEYITYHEQLLASAGRKTGVQINGEEIYKAKCVACHQFDTKLVGPPHKEVLKKYENRKEDMVKFILNPVKVDPNYPPMPNQGLKPQEAEAVVNYMFEHYGPMLK